MIQPRAVILDWAGTAVDFGCFAPVAPFVAALAEIGVTVTASQARVPMGLSKRDHLAALLRAHAPERLSDLDAGYALFEREQLACVARHADLLPGLLEAVAALRARGLTIGTTTGYFPEAFAVVRRVAQEAGYRPDVCVTPDEVSAGRPYPWMLWRALERLNVYPPSLAVKFGDTAPDMQEARNAGCWAVGVTDTGSPMGLTAAEFAALGPGERDRRRAAVAEELRAAGAHLVVGSVADAPAALEWVAGRLAAGERASVGA